MNRKYLLISGQLPERLVIESTPHTKPNPWVNQYQDITSFSNRGVQNLIEVYTRTVGAAFREQVENQLLYGQSTRPPRRN